MKTSSMVAGFCCLFVISLSCPSLVASKSNATLVDAASVQLLGKLPSGAMFLFDGRKLFQFAGSYKRIGVIDATSSVVKKDGKWLSDEPTRYVNIYRAWPDLQRKAAALGANAIIITGEDIDNEGFERSHGSPGVMETIGVVIADAVILQGTTKEVAELAQGPSTDSHLLKSKLAQGQNSAPLSIGSAFETQFLYPIEIRMGSPKLPAGDVIAVTSLKGDRPHVEVGGSYLVSGQYKLASADEATLVVTVASEKKPAVRTYLDSEQLIKIHRGSGSFSLILPMRYEGRLHIWFRPTPDEKVFRGLYFAER